MGALRPFDSTLVNRPLSPGKKQIEYNRGNSTRRDSRVEQAPEESRQLGKPFGL